MPELPEVETIKKAIQQKLGQAQFLDIKIKNPHLRQPVPQNLADILRGHNIKSYKRIAKYIVIETDNDYSLILHMGMSGRIRLSDKQDAEQKHDHIVFKTNNGYMVYNDARRFGLCLCLPTDDLRTHPLFKKIGIDPFDEHLNGAILKDKLIKKMISIKLALLDQSIICGIGNIYASEALFLARILPTRKACSLSLKECDTLIKAVRKTLSAAIEAGGSTLKDYRQPDGNLGYFQNQHCVYGKAGQACPDCICQLEKTGGIQKLVMGGRSTYFCATKQR